MRTHTSTRLFLTVFSLIFCLSLAAQNKTLYNEGFTTTSVNGQLQETQAKSVNNTVLMTQDFSSTQFPPPGWTMTIVAGTLGWSRGVGPQTFITFNPTGTTAANGYAFVNSDGNGGSGGTEHTILRTPAINCAGQSYVWLKFNNLFYQYGSSTGNVQVSNNGTSWTTVHSSHTGLAQNVATPNPQFVDVNISAYAANQATVYVRFVWTGAYDYYWFVDDVEIYAKTPYDVTIESAENPNEYSVVPKPHYNMNAIPLSATARNVGGAAVSGVKVKFNVYDGNTGNLMHTAQSTPSGPIAANSTVVCTAPAYPITNDTAYYINEYIVSMTQQDGNTSNDTLYRYFWISDTIYGRDDAFYTATLDGSLGIGTGGEAIMGQHFRLRTPDKLSNVRFYVTGPAIGDTTTMYLYSTLPDGTPNALLAQSAPYKFVSDSGQWVVLTFQAGTLSLDTGTYYIGLKNHVAGANIGLGYTNNNYMPGKAWVKVNANPWQKTEDLGFACAYLIRPSFVCAGFMPSVQPVGQVAMCQGGQVQLTASAGTAYLWSPGGQTTQSINVSTPGSYTVSVSNSYGCGALTDTVHVFEMPNPVVNLGPDDTVCASVILNAGGPFASYSWAGGSSTTQYLNVTTTGNYIVVVTDSLGCVGMDSIHITIEPVPTLNLGPDVTICTYETLVLDAGQGFTSYLWSNQATSQTVNLSGSTLGIGTYTFFVEATAPNTCIVTDTIVVTVDGCVGMNEVDDAKMRVYPNPAGDYIFIQIPQNINGLLSIKDVLGRTLKTLDISQGFNSQINVSNLSHGVYIIELTTTDKTELIKLFINR